MFSGLTNSIVPFTSKDMSELWTPGKNSRFNLLSPCFWTAGRGKSKIQMQQRSAWLLHEVVIITIPPEKLSWYWFLGKMGHISMNQLCYFIPAPFISCSSSFLLGPKAGLALPTALIKEKVIFLAGNESLQYTVLSVDEEEKQSAKRSGCVLEGLLDFLAAGTSFFLAVEQHFFVAEGRRDLLSQTHETGKDRMRSSAESGGSSHV